MIDAKKILVLIFVAALLQVNFSCDHVNIKTQRSILSGANELNTYLERIQQAYLLPSIGVTIIADDEAYVKAFGHADLSSFEKANDSTVFFTGNISELMVATAIASLASSGKIHLDDPVVKHLPYFKLGTDTYQEIRISHLLTQTSGIPKHDAVWDLPYNESDALELTTRSISLQQHEFTPGSKVKRSNYHYDILADLISKVSGMTYEKYVHDNIFEPLGMTSATCLPGDIAKARLARPHAVKNWLTYSRDTLATYPYNREHAGSIGFHASIQDMKAWMFAMLHNRTRDGKQFLNADIHRSLINDHYKTGENTFIGFGWEITKGATSILNKNHTIGGFSADLTLIPEEKIAVFIVTNTSEEFNPGFVRQQVIEWLRGKSLSQPVMPANIALGKKLATTGCLDSVFMHYEYLKNNHANDFDLSEQVLNQFGVTLVHRLQRLDDGISVYKFLLGQFPVSAEAHVNLAEAFLLQNNIEQAEAELAVAKKLSIEETSSKAHLAYIAEAIAIRKEPKHDQISDYVESVEYP